MLRGMLKVLPPGKEEQLLTTYCKMIGEIWPLLASIRANDMTDQTTK